MIPTGDNMKARGLKQMTFRRWSYSRRGQSLVEFAMVAPLFFMLIFGITDFGRLFFTKLTLQHALREAGRYAVTGQKLTGNIPGTTNPYTRVESIKAIAQKYAVGLLSSTSSIVIQAKDANGNVDAAHPAGLPGETVIVSLSTSLRLITPLIGQFFPKDMSGNGVYNFTVSTAFKNEPFDIGDAD